MAQQLPCDICGDETAVQMLTNLESGAVMTLGPACSWQFYQHSLLAMIGSEGHKGIPGKCQACRRIHERATVQAVPIGTSDQGDTTAADPAGAGDEVSESG